MSMRKSKVIISSSVMKGLSKLDNKENLNKEEITKIINMLKAYENLCIQSEDFNGADSVKIKIQQLKSQELLFQKWSIAVKEKNT
jgi:protein tyrosine/serine phosphatase